MPLVSIILTTCNRPEWLREAVASVVAQTFWDWQLTVINNGGADTDLTEISGLMWPKICVTKTEPCTIGAARNIGAEYSLADYLLFLDDDDVLMPDAIENLIRRPQLVGSYGLPVLLDTAGNRISEPINNRPPGALLHLSDLSGNINMVTPPGCALIRRSAFEAAGGWDESGHVRESVELFFRLLKQGSMACVPQAVIGYRQHEGQLSRVRNQDRGQWERTQASLQTCLQEVYGA